MRAALRRRSTTPRSSTDEHRESELEQSVVRAAIMSGAGSRLYRHLSTLRFGAIHAFAARRRNALPMTETDERLIASAAMSGLNNQPVNGYNTPAARGTPRAL
jgi:hypothetical protein